MIQHILTEYGSIIGAAAAGMLVGFILAWLVYQIKRSRIQTENEALKQQIELAEKHKQEALEMLRASFREQLQLEEARFETLSNRILNSSVQQLRSDNKEQMEPMIHSIKDKLRDLAQSVQDANTSNQANKAALETHLRLMMQQTQKLDKEAAALTRALKGESKTQGDWGETILERLLEVSGLRENEEYYVQYNVKNEQGKNVRPDVVVELPGLNRVIIDSKVSLTHYANSMATEDEAERQRLLKAHHKSVIDHIDELANKKYSDCVEGALGHVLMFFPYEASYIAAMEYDRKEGKKELQIYAYNKGVLLMSPSTLLMALVLAKQLWRKQKHDQNIKLLLKQVCGIYDECYRLTESFSQLGKQLDKAQESYTRAMGQFKSGKGNLVHRVIQFGKTMGYDPRKELSESETDVTEVAEEEE